MRFSVGIDLGTTNTVVSIARKGITGNIEVNTENISQLSEDSYSLDNDPLLPSVLYVNNDHEHIVGKFAKAMKGQNTSRVIFNSKNFIGENDYEWVIDDKKYTPELVAGHFLRAIRNYLVDKYVNSTEDIDSAVITVPASFNVDQRDATKRAAKLAGFSGDITLISEPTAAILDFINEQSKFDDSARDLDFSDFKNVLVFDLGGGTCDVAILKIKINEKNIQAEEIGVSPHTLIGGTNFDAYATAGVLKDFSKENNIDFKKELSEETLKKLKNLLFIQLEKIKLQFSSKYLFGKNKNVNIDDLVKSIEYTITIPNIINGKPFKYKLNMEKYNKYISPLLDKENDENIINPIDETLNNCDMKKEDIDYVFCVGGMTNYSKVWESIRDYFGKEPCKFSDSMQSVSRGAAIYHHYEVGLTKKDNEKSKGENKNLGTTIDIIPRLPQSVFLNVKNGFPVRLIESQTKAGTPILHENLIKVSSEIGLVLELYTGKSNFDPNMKKLNNVKLEFPYGVKVGSDIVLSLEYTTKGVLNFEAWLKDDPTIKIEIKLEDGNLNNCDDYDQIKDVKGVV